MADERELDEPQLSEEQRELLAQRAQQMLAQGQSLAQGSNHIAALSTLTEAAYLLIGLRHEGASEAISTLVEYIQGLGEEQFDTAAQQMDEQHRGMLDQIVTLLQQMEAQGEGDEDGDGEIEITPEQRSELLQRAAQMLAEGREASNDGEHSVALTALVEAAAIYTALDDDHKEEALAAFVGLIQSVEPDELNQLAGDLDPQHQSWLLGLMKMLQQRTVQEHGPEIRAAAEQALAQAQQAEQAGDHGQALAQYGEAFNNASSLGEEQLTDTVMTSFAAFADRLGPGDLGVASHNLDQRGHMAFQLLLSALAEMRDPTH